MNKFLKNITYISLIASYFFAASVGNIIVLRELLNSSDTLHKRITSERKSRSIPDSPVNIVKFHTLPVIDSGHSFHTVPTIDFPLLTEHTALIVNAEIALIYSSLEFLPSKPRDPPLA